VFVVSGNQGGKTSGIAFDYVTSVLGLNPNPMHNKYCQKTRCLSSSLPENTDPGAQDNAQYMEVKKLLPYENIKKDITARSQTMTISGAQGKHYLEFMSTKQDVQDTGKVQRDRLWVDEEPSKDHWNESRMRLLAFDGGLTQVGLTAINGLSWTYDTLYLRASYFWRSEIVAKMCGLPREENYPERDKNIAVVNMATDDNPTLTPQGIEFIMSGVDDPDEYMVRRYGIFKQISGRVHKSYNPAIHYIGYDKYFPNGIPYEWKHVRGIDYHESRIPWSIGWLSASKEDEWFLWREFHPPIDGPHSYTTEEICRHIIRNSGDFYYLFNLIDPLANKKQANTGFSVTEDMNRIFAELRRQEGLGTEAYWEGWDTKDTKGRDEIRKRFKNAAMVGKPFANVVRKHGETERLPTLWICDTCPEFNKSILRWSFGEWSTMKTKQINEKQSKPQPKFSHDPMVLECIAKDARLRYYEPPPQIRQQRYSATGRPI
jgi:hypothetical protein